MMADWWATGEEIRLRSYYQHKDRLRPSDDQVRWRRNFRQVTSDEAERDERRDLLRRAELVVKTAAFCHFFRCINIPAFDCR